MCMHRWFIGTQVSVVIGVLFRIITTVVTAYPFLALLALLFTFFVFMWRCGARSTATVKPFTTSVELTFNEI